MKSTTRASVAQIALRFTLRTLVAAALFTGATSTLLAQAGVPFSWGWNSDGQIGDGSHNDRLAPFKISKLSGIAQVARSGISSFARRSNGSVYAWGANDSGQLGLGTTLPAAFPTKITTLSSIGDISASPYHAIAVKGDGTVWAWGNNDSGQVGNGSTNTALSPVKVSGMTKAVRVAAGSFHSLALKSDGTVWAWGYNGFGELGNNTEDSSSLPVQVAGLTNVVQISAGEVHSLALKADGTVWAWGSNQAGQFGDGTLDSSDTPIQLPNLNNVVQIAAGGYHSLFLKSDGTVWSAGFNNSGQLGDGTTTNSPAPQQASGLSSVIQIAGGESHSLALKSDGTVWTWGANAEGELGDGDTTSSSVPVQVSGMAQQTFIAAGYQHSLSVQAAQVQAKLSASNALTRYGQPIKLSVQLKDGVTTLPLIQASVNITLDGAVVATVTTDTAGRASIMVPNPENYDVGTYAIGATFAGNRLYLAATGAGTLTINPDGATLAASNASAYLGATTKIRASLINSLDKSPLSSESLSLSLDGSVIGEITTDTLGKATLNYFVDEPLAIGIHVLAIDFAGDTNTLPAHWQGKLTVLRTSTKLGSFHATTNAGATIPFKVRLTRTTDKKSLANQTVHFVIGGVEIGSAITNSSGIAQLNYATPLDMAAGDYPVTLSFSGDTNYLPISNSLSVLTINP